MHIEKRNITFNLNPEKIFNWHGFGNATTHFFNSLSFFFPHGERYFISSVRKFRGSVTSSQLQKDVSAFIGQEAFHGREHERMNELFSTKREQDLLKNILDWAEDNLPDSTNLAFTIALEHLTAILAETLIKNQHTFAGSDSDYQRLWTWHAIEETEHKAVAFDVYDNCVDHKFKYLERTGALVLVSLLFALGHSYVLSKQLIKNEEYNIANIFHYTLGNPGLVRQVIPQWFKWFSPKFHPWDMSLEEQKRFDQLLSETKNQFNI